MEMQKTIDVKSSWLMATFWVFLHGDLQTEAMLLLLWLVRSLVFGDTVATYILLALVSIPTLSFYTLQCCFDYDW